SIGNCVGLRQGIGSLSDCNGCSECTSIIIRDRYIIISACKGINIFRCCCKSTGPSPCIGQWSSATCYIQINCTIADCTSSIGNCVGLRQGIGSLSDCNGCSECT